MRNCSRPCRHSICPTAPPWEEIKARHRELVRRYHPDAGKQNEPERIRHINTAYQILLGYCAGYRFSFSQEEFYEQNPEERLRQQFSQDPLWGGGSES